ncbi:hypothetical protein M8J77_023008 [Diaphorina citri]|nr:hypothetical protein M8J77_023008 [Diaphorina citri]
MPGGARTSRVRSTNRPILTRNRVSWFFGYLVAERKFKISVYFGPSKYPHQKLSRTMLGPVSRLCLKVTSRTLSIQTMSLSSSTQLDLTGVFSALPTPFREDEEIDFEKFKFNVSKWEKVPLKGYAIGGTNGEQPFLTEEEKLKIISTLRQETKKTIIAGTYCEFNSVTFTKSYCSPHITKILILLIPHSQLCDLLEVILLSSQYHNPHIASPT